VVLGSFVLAGEPVTDTSDAPKLPDNPLQKKLGMAEAVELPIRMEGGAMGQMREAVYKGQKVDIRTLVREHGLAWSFNGVAGLPERPLRRVARGRTVSMPFINDTRWPHTMHVHGHHFQLLQKNGAPINDGPWRDTVIVDPGDRIDVAFVADNPGKWLIHCHMAEHMAAGMETWFEVV
jgi:FtsP/CotA-like multicopper oxidase with cupredoxin domain